MISGVWHDITILTGVQGLPAVSGSAQSSQHAEQQQQQQREVQSCSVLLAGGDGQQVNSLRVRDHVSGILQRADGSRAGVQVSAGDQVEQAGLVVDVSGRKQCRTVSLGDSGG